MSSSRHTTHNINNLLTFILSAFSLFITAVPVSSSALSSNNMGSNNMNNNNFNYKQQAPPVQILTPERKEEILDNLSQLSNHSSPSTSSDSGIVSHEEQLQIIEEIKQQVRKESWLYTDDTGTMKSSDYEVALLKMAPFPPTATDDNAKDNQKITYSNDVKKYQSFSKFSLLYGLFGALDVYRDRLEYLISTRDGNNTRKKPKFLKNVTPLFDSNDRSGTDNGSGSANQKYIHGPTWLPYLLHKFELWSTTNNADTTFVNENQMIHNDSGDEYDDREKNNDIKNEKAGVTLVLGAGNQSSISLNDILHCIFIHPRKPILFKHHPLRSHFLYHPYNEILKPLIKRKLLYTVEDYGLEFTKELIQRKEITSIHLTGALSTSEAIKRTYAQTRPELSKEDVENDVTSELGCVTPCIITPDKYTRTELKSCIKHLLFGKKMFSGSNCLATQAIILSEDWEQKELFREMLKEEMKHSSTDPSYYPGSLDRVKEIVSMYDKDRVEQVISPVTQKCRFRYEKEEEKEFLAYNDNIKSLSHPYLIECGVAGSKNYNDYAIQNEAFGPILAIVEVPNKLYEGSNNENDNDNKNESELYHKDKGINFLTNSGIPFVNDKQNIFGTLSCMLMHPSKSIFTDHQYRKLMKQNVISRLNYGTVAVNTNSFMGYAALGYGGQWGAHLKDHRGQSGNGYIGNGFGVNNVDKTVVYGQSLSFPLVLLQKRFSLPSFCLDFISNFMLVKSKFRFKLPFMRC